MAEDLSPESLLTVEIAKNFIADPDSVDLAAYTRVEEEAWPVLVQYKYQPSVVFRRWGLYLDGVKTLTPSAIETLSQFEGELSLTGISELSDEAAKVIARTCKLERWNLSGLTKLTNQPGHIELAAQFNYRWFPKLVELPAEIATAFVNNKNGSGLGLEGVVQLSEQTAGILAQFKGALKLNGLTQLTDEVASRLGGHEGDLELHGVTDLSDSAAEALFGHRSGDLGLNGLRTISKGAAELLAKQSCEWLFLRGVTALSDEAAEALGKFQGMNLYMDHLSDISDKAAEFLKRGLLTEEIAERFVDDWTERGTRNERPPDETREFLLGLNGFRKIDVEAIKFLVKNLDKNLCLNGVIELSDSAAKALAKHDDGVELNGLQKLSEKAAAALSKLKGYRLSLNGLTEISDEVAAALSGYDGTLELNGLGSLSDKAAKSLAKHVGCLHLKGLKALSDKAIAALAKHHDRLMLGLTQISPKAAASLANHTDLYLEILNNLSIEAAEKLAKSKFRLELDRLRELPLEVAKALVKHKDNLERCVGWGVLQLNGLAEISGPLAEVLAEYPGVLQLRGVSKLDSDSWAGFKAFLGEKLILGVETITDEDAELVSQFRGPGKLELYGLKTLSAKAKKLLASVPEAFLGIASSIRENHPQQIG